MSVLSIIGILYIGDVLGKNLPQYYFVSDSYKVLAVALGVSAFMFFKNIIIPQSRLINKIAQSCFGVLLIHTCCDAMRQWLWKDMLNVEGQYNTDTFVLHSFLSVLGIFILCTIIDQVRIYSLEKPLFAWLNRKKVFEKWQNKA